MKNQFKEKIGIAIIIGGYVTVISITIKIIITIINSRFTPLP